MKKLILIPMLFLIAGCSVHAPEIRVTGEKTALENQIIGTYEEIRNDTWMVASLRSKGQKKVTTSVEKKKVLNAVQNRKFNKDEVDEYKRKSILGENNQGYLEIVKPELLESEDLVTKNRVKTLVQEENQDRRIIYNRVVEVNESAADAGESDVLQVFAKMNRESAEAGTWVQQPNGEWVKK